MLLSTDNPSSSAVLGFITHSQSSQDSNQLSIFLKHLEREHLELWFNCPELAAWSLIFLQISLLSRCPSCFTSHHPVAWIHCCVVAHPPAQALYGNSGDRQLEYLCFSIASGASAKTMDEKRHLTSIATEKRHLRKCCRKCICIASTGQA